LFDTIVDLAKDRTQVIPFNLASEALNNSFFLNGLVSLISLFPNGTETGGSDVVLLAMAASE
jgi:hypothetical protein